MLSSGPEIERSWVLKFPFDIEKARGDKAYHEIGYIITDPGELRLVLKGLESPEYFITVKSDGDLTRDEWEKYLPKWAFHQLWPKTEGTRVIKTRYYVYYNNFCLEVDRYHGDLDRLWRVECEFTSEQEAKEFTLPDWIGKKGSVKEVTNDKRYKNKSLAQYGLPEDWNKF